MSRSPALRLFRILMQHRKKDGQVHVASAAHFGAHAAVLLAIGQGVPFETKDARIMAREGLLADGKTWATLYAEACTRRHLSACESLEDWACFEPYFYQPLRGWMSGWNGSSLGRSCRVHHEALISWNGSPHRVIVMGARSLVLEQEDLHLPALRVTISRSEWNEEMKRRRTAKKPAVIAA